MDLINLLLPKIEHLGILGYWIIFFISFFESLAFFGLLIPGSTLLVIFGFLSSKGYLDAGDLFWFAAAGAIIGDAISYYLGKRGKKIFAEEKKIFSLSNLEKGEKFFKKYGNKSVFLARFLGPMRPIVPFIAGLFKMETRQFFFWNILSAFGWAVLFVYLGYFFGQAWRIIEIWSTRIGILIFAIIAVFIIFYILKQLIYRHGKHFSIFIKTLSLSIWKTIITNPDIKNFSEKHIKLISFLRERSSLKTFTGFPLTLMGVALIYIISLLSGLINGILKNKTIVTIDTNVENLLYIFRHPILVKIFLWVTAIEEWQIMVFIIFTLLILFIYLKKKDYIMPLYLSAAGSIIFSEFGKIIVKRIRPQGFIPIYIEDSYSFPSGHAIVAMAIFGFLAYILTRNVKNWKLKINITFSGIIIILAIGFSRLYLGVHYLSDVLGGYLIGFIWLMISIMYLEWGERGKFSREKDKMKQPYALTAISIFMVVNLIFFLAVGPRIMPQAMAENQTNNYKIIGQDSIINIFKDSELPQFSETLSGKHQEPLSFIIISKDQNNVIASFNRSGWLKSDDINPPHVLQLIQALAFNTNYPTAPITPSFWNNTANTYGFEKPVNEGGIRKRHHARIWTTNYKTDTREQIFVATASLDENIKWGITHAINPNIDAERETLFSDLENSKSIIDFKKLPFVPSLLGKNFIGDPFYTDGYIYIIKM